MTQIGNTLDDHFVERTVQGINPFPIQDFVKPASQLGLSPISSIGPVVPQYSPILTPPNPMTRLIRTYENGEELAKQQTDSFQILANNTFIELDGISSEDEAMLRQIVKSKESRDSWGAVETISKYLATASTLTLGATMPGLFGTLLLIAGTAGGITTVLKDTNLLEPILEWFTKSEELQTSIQKNIDTGAMYLQLLAFAGGSAMAWQAGTFAATNTLHYLTKASSLLSTTSGMMNVTSQVAVTFHRKQIADKQAEIKRNEVKTFEQKGHLSSEIKVMSKVLDENTSRLKLMQKLIQKQKV